VVAAISGVTSYVTAANERAQSQLAQQNNSLPKPFHLCKEGEIILRQISENSLLPIFVQNCVVLPLLATKEAWKDIIGYIVLRVEIKKAEMDMEWLLGSKILLSSIRMK
jgi:hypothetical protein